MPSTKEEINAALLHLGHAPVPTAKRVGEFHAAARQAGIMLKADWLAQVAHEAHGREFIPEDWHVALTTLHRVVQRHSQATKFVRNGRAEVSVFYTDSYGDRYKARFDYLRVRTLSDVKTHAYREGMEPIASFCQARDRYGYDFSAACYMEARLDALPKLVAAGQVYRCETVPFVGVIASPADAEDMAFFEEVAAFDDPSWWWIACMTQGVPECDTIEFPRDLIAFSAAQSQVAQARETYRKMRATFGADDAEMWTVDRGLIRLTEFNFNQRSMERGLARYEVIS